MQDALAGHDEGGGAQAHPLVLRHLPHARKGFFMMRTRRALISSSLQKKLEKSCTYSKQLTVTPLTLQKRCTARRAVLMFWLIWRVGRQRLRGGA